MSESINYYGEIYKRKINKDSPFLLVGNNIDGYIDIDIIGFENFIDVESRLLSILSNLECRGEWDVKLYQIEKPYRIYKKYGYYKYPTKSKLIYEHSYMNFKSIKSILKQTE